MAELILVDQNDNIVGYKSKAECHQNDGLLHRAFSIFVFNRNNELLIQQRSRLKPLWPLFWSNSCCSHPERGDDIQQAAQRRLEEELGFTCKVEYIYKFIYNKKYKNLGAEYELCHVLSGRYDGRVTPNAEEVAAVRWLPIEVLKRELSRHPQKYTPWFQLEMDTLKYDINFKQWR